MFGLSDDTLAKITACLARFPDIRSASSSLAAYAASFDLHTPIPARTAWRPLARPRCG